MRAHEGGIRRNETGAQIKESRLTVLCYFFSHFDFHPVGGKFHLELRAAFEHLTPDVGQYHTLHVKISAF